jgi:hypothetical protein
LLQRQVLADRVGWEAVMVNNAVKSEIRNNILCSCTFSAWWLLCLVESGTLFLLVDNFSPTSPLLLKTEYSLSSNKNFDLDLAIPGQNDPLGPPSGHDDRNIGQSGHALPRSAGQLPRRLV